MRYQPRKPQATPLYQSVASHMHRVLDEAEQYTETGGSYPAFVRREFQSFLTCGILDHGFIRLRCERCRQEHLLPFSCKRRGICPSCSQRRAHDTAAHLTTNVLPQVPYRQWVVSLPKRIRLVLAKNDELCAKVLSLSLRKVFAYHRHRARRLGIANGQAGAVTLIQRFSSMLTLNVHFHILIPDGVFHKGPTSVDFLPLPAPSLADIHALLQKLARAITKTIQSWQRDCSDEEPNAFLQLQTQSLNWTPGPHRPPQANPKGLCASTSGFSLHANRAIHPNNRQALADLCRYGARAPVAESRLSRDSRGHLRYQLRRPIAGRSILILKPDEFIRRLISLIPPPRRNLTRYHGVFAPGHSLRPHIVPKPTEADSRPRSYRLPWAELLRRAFASELLRCQNCGAPVKIVSIIAPPSDAIGAILQHRQATAPSGYPRNAQHGPSPPSPVDANPPPS